MPRPRKILASLLATLLLCGSLLATSSAAHQGQHRDGQAHPDTCFLCLVAQGKLDQPSPTQPSIVRELVAVAAPVDRGAQVVLPTHRLLPPGRAPPCFTLTRQG